MDNFKLANFLFGNNGVNTKNWKINNLIIKGSIALIVGLLLILDNFFILTSFLNYNSQIGILSLENIAIYYPLRAVMLIIGFLVSVVGFHLYDSALKESLGKIVLLKRSALYLFIGVIIFILFAIIVKNNLFLSGVCNEQPGCQAYIPSSQLIYMTLLYFISILFMVLSSIILALNLFSVSKKTGIGIIGIASPLFIVPYLDIVAALIILMCAFIVSLRGGD